jgi:hypothetical protein
MSENRIKKRIFGSRKESVTGSMWADYLTNVAKTKNIGYKKFNMKAERKRQIGRPGPTWDNNIKMGLKEDMRMWTGFIWLRIMSIVGLL